MATQAEQRSPGQATLATRAGKRSRAQSGSTRRYCTINLSMPPSRPPLSPLPPSPASDGTVCLSGSEGTTLATLSDGSETDFSNAQDDIAFPQPPPLTPLLRRMQSEPSLPHVDHAAVSAILSEMTIKKQAALQIPRHPAPFPEFPSTAEELESWADSQQNWVLYDAEADLDFSWEAQTPPLSIKNIPASPRHPLVAADAVTRRSTVYCDPPIASVSSPAIGTTRHRHSVYATDSRYVATESLPPVPRMPQVIRKMTSLRQTLKDGKQSTRHTRAVASTTLPQRISRPEDAFEKRKPTIRHSTTPKSSTAETNRRSFIAFKEDNPSRRFLHRPQQSLPRTFLRGENLDYNNCDRLPPRARPAGVYGTVPPVDPRVGRRLTKGSRPITGMDSFMDMKQESEPMTRQEKVVSMLTRASMSFKKGWNKALVRKKSFGV